MQSILDQIDAFTPHNEQEQVDRDTLRWYIDQFPDTVLLRENRIAHITSSGFLLNANLDRALMIHHNIRDTWAWTGGHADGDADLLQVAIREAMEETGATHIRPLTKDIASIDILYVLGHIKRGQYVGTHLHLSIAYLLYCDENDPLQVKPDENSGVQWFPVDAIQSPAFDVRDVYLYGKLIARAREAART